MDNYFSVFAIIAENRILEAEKNGVFENLPGMGQPLDLADDSAVPQDLRMAWKILKNAGCLPPEIEERKEIARLTDLLANCKDEAKMHAAEKKARFLLERLQNSRRRHVMLDENDPCYMALVAKLAGLRGNKG